MSETCDNFQRLVADEVTSHRQTVSEMNRIQNQLGEVNLDLNYVRRLLSESNGELVRVKEDAAKANTLSRNQAEEIQR